MHKFCFNDCIPNNATSSSLSQSLEQTLKEYRKLKENYPVAIDGIITSNSFSNYIISKDSSSLADCVSLMTDKDLRTFAFRVFTKYPLEKYYDEINEEDLLSNDYTLEISGTTYSAINPVIVSVNNGILFTLGLHDDICKDILTISSKSNTKVEVNNLFGRESNTAFIKRFIDLSLVSKLGNFEKLLNLIGPNRYSSRFSTSFEGLTEQIQVSIIEHFEKAIARNGNSKLFADGDLIKDVTLKSDKYRVYELRIFSPVAYRIYFYETESKTYLALLEKKPAQKKQSIHITASSSTINQMISLEAK